MHKKILYFPYTNYSIFKSLQFFQKNDNVSYYPEHFIGFYLVVFTDHEAVLIGTWLSAKMSIYTLLTCSVLQRSSRITINLVDKV